MSARRLPSRPRAVVTGAGSGLGRAFVLELASRGGRVLAADIDEEGAEHTAALGRRHGGEVRVRRCDVSRREDIAALEEEATAWLGNTDVLVNNAGVAVSGPFDTVSVEDWQWIVGINLWGVIYGCQAFLPAMRRRDRGHIINVASIAGLIAPAMMSPYNVTKSAVVALSESLSAELKDTSVNVTVLCPSFFKTNILRSLRGDSHLRPVAEELMMRSKIQAPEVAQAALAASEAGQLYCVPMADARAIWRLKRALPHRFTSILARMQDSSVAESRWLQRLLGAVVKE